MMKIIAAAVVLSLMPGLAPASAYLDVISRVTFPSPRDNYKSLFGSFKNIARFPSASLVPSSEIPAATPSARTEEPRYLAPTTSSSGRRSPSAIASGGGGAARIRKRMDRARPAASIGARAAEGAVASRLVASLASQSSTTPSAERSRRARPAAPTLLAPAVKKASDGMATKASGSANRGTPSTVRPRAASKLKPEVAKRRALGNYRTG